jgi:beta-phosphoglucomutase
MRFYHCSRLRLRSASQAPLRLHGILEDSSFLISVFPRMILPPHRLADKLEDYSFGHSMLRAIIFDFNGIILDDEPLHFLSMQQAVAQAGITITQEEYWTHYLPLDAERCLETICKLHNVQLSPDQRHGLLQSKSERYSRLLQSKYPLFPGAERFIRTAAARYPLAIASGARRVEIENALAVSNLMSHFCVIVAAEDFVLGKPHPESFLLALKILNERLNGKSSPILPGDCLVIEDAVAGVDGARAAGMKCLAVSNSYPPDRLLSANRVVTSLEEVELESLSRIFEEPS